MSSDTVDFEAVKRNAALQGVDLQEIAIRYDGLTADELGALEAHQEVTHRIGGGAVLAKFPLTGDPLFQHKATAVISLGA